MEEERGQREAVGGEEQKEQEGKREGEHVQDEIENEDLETEA